MSDTATIYALVNPRDARVRYVGKANDPEKRAASHVGRAAKTLKFNLGMGAWLQGLRAAGLTPGVLVLEEVPRDSWEAAEVRWIKDLKESGFDLLNLHSGGAGSTRAWNKNRRLSLSHCANIGRANKGKVLTAEHRAKIAAGHLRIVPWNKGIPTPESTRQKISEANRLAFSQVSTRLLLSKRTKEYWANLSNEERAARKKLTRDGIARRQFERKKEGGQHGSSA